MIGAVVSRSGMLRSNAPLLQMSRDFQALCQARLKKLSEAGNDIDSKELRQLAMAYKDSREWLKELIGLVELQNEMEAKDETAT